MLFKIGFEPLQHFPAQWTLFYPVLTFIHCGHKPSIEFSFAVSIFLPFTTGAVNK